MRVNGVPSSMTSLIRLSHPPSLKTSNLFNPIFNAFQLNATDSTPSSFLFGQLKTIANISSGLLCRMIKTKDGSLIVVQLIQWPLTQLILK